MTKINHQSYIVYWDSNNFDGLAISEYLPYKNLRLDRSVELSDILKTTYDNYIEYTVEVELHFRERFA